MRERKNKENDLGDILQEGLESMESLATTLITTDATIARVTLAAKRGASKKELLEILQGNGRTGSGGEGGGGLLR